MAKAKKFEKPEDGYEGLTPDELTELSDAALDEYATLTAIADEDITDEQLDRLEFLKGEISAIRAEVSAQEVAAQNRADRIAAAKAGVDEDGDDDADADGDDGDADEGDADGDDDSEGDDDADGDADGDDENADADERKPALVASGRKGAVRRAASATRGRTRKVTKAADEDQADKAKVTITAKADVRGFASGAELDMDGMTKAFMARMAGYPSKRVGKQFLKHAVADLNVPAEERAAEFAISDRMSLEEQWEKVMAASKESRLPNGSLVAAGGWCAPSVPLFDLCQWETTSGALDLPELTITRGGLNFTKGPAFEDIYSNTGFLQTEDDAIAGEVKTFLEVECPDWEEVRLDAIGYGVKAPILTGSPAGYPELIRRYLEGALVAHWHRKNAYKINKIVGMLQYMNGGIANFPEVGGGTADLLNAIEVAAQSLRYRFRLGENATLEAMFPMWVKSALRADLSRRTGVDMLGVTDAQIQSWFTMRGIRPQFVYDWSGQDLAGDALQFPTSVDFGIWPAGTFVAGTNSIISLDAIYDSTEIEVNTYTAAFFEEAILVANTCGDGRLFRVGLDYSGLTGAAVIGQPDGS